MMNSEINHGEPQVFKFCILKTNTKIFSNKITFEIDLGLQATSSAHHDAVNAKTEKVTGYSNLVDALNYLSNLGWEIVHVNYREFSGTTHNNPEYLLKRRV